RWSPRGQRKATLPHAEAVAVASKVRRPIAAWRLKSRGGWWPRPDSNRHSGFPEADFKSAVSTVPPRGPRASVLALAARALEADKLRVPTVHHAAPHPGQGCSILQGVAPDLFPVLAGKVGNAAVALVEFVRDLEHRQHQSALGGAGDVAAPRLAPDELAGLDLEPRGRTFLVHQLALEHVGLLDLDVLEGKLVDKEGPAAGLE